MARKSGCRVCHGRVVKIGDLLQRGADVRPVGFKRSLGPMSSLSSAVISLAIAAGVAGVLAEVPGGDEARRLPEVPLAALAWAQLYCDPTLSARPATPGVQYEDFMRVTAAYDGMRIDEGIAVACGRAMNSALSVTQILTLRP